VFESIAPKYSQYIGLMYADTRRYAGKRMMLGVTWDDVPALAFSMTDNRILTYPREMPIEKDTLMSWIDDVFKGRVQASNTYEREVVDKEIGTRFLNNTMVASRENFTSIVLEEGYDVLLIVYTSQVEHQ